MKTEKLKIKDIITITLLSLINVVLFLASSFLYLNPVTVLLMPVFFGLADGIVFFTIGVKVQKRGAILIYCLIRGILGGYLPYILCHIATGLAAELILRKIGYGRTKGLSISYILIELLAAVGSTFYPFLFDKNTALKAEGMYERTIEASKMLRSWVSFALLAAILLASFFGTRIAKRILRKHLLSENTAADHKTNPQD